MASSESTPNCFVLGIEGSLLIVTFSGEPILEDLLALDRQIQALPELERLQSMLLDLREASLNRLEADDLRAFARQPPILAAESRRAIVATSDQTYGLARMYEQLYAESSPNLQVFREIEAARAWLSS